MRRIVVDMQNGLFADAIAHSLRRFDPNFDVYPSEQPEKTLEVCQMVNANILIMEATSFAPRGLDERLSLRNDVKSQMPDCRIVLIVDETGEKALAEKIRQAKKDGLIDEFIYGSISSDYLSALIDTL